MARFFLEPDSWGDRASLAGDEAKHCARVLRAKQGDSIEVFDGCGRSANATIEAVSSRRIDLRLGETSSEEAPACEIVLVPAVLKGKAMEWLIQKAVEIGVHAIEPVTTVHGVAKPGDGKEHKWRRIALEACKQCGRNRIPTVTPPKPLSEWLEEKSEGLRLVASLASGTRPLKEVLSTRENDSKISYLVGPEGDFTGQESELCLKMGCQPVSLAEQVMRAETAGIFGISALSYELLSK